jgi:hypothetical protein
MQNGALADILTIVITNALINDKLNKYSITVLCGASDNSIFFVSVT